MNTKPPIGLLTQQVPWLKELASEEQQIIWGRLRPQVVGQEHPFLWPDQADPSIHIIVKGRVKLFQWHPVTDRCVTLDVLGPGDLMPLNGLLNSSDSSPSITYHLESLESTLTLNAPLSAWNQWLTQIPNLQKVIMQMVALQLNELSLKLEEVSLYSVQERLIRLLERDQQFQNQRGFSRLEGLCQQAIAEQIGTSRVPLCRELQGLEKNKKISRNRRHILLLDNQAQILASPPS